MIDIIIVSHGNYEDLEFIFSELSGHDVCKIWLRDNLAQKQVKELCDKYCINYSAALRREGFALNNNIIAEKVINERSGASEEDKNHYLLFMNPDAFISKANLEKLVEKISTVKPDMFTIDLYKDDHFQIRDPSIRHFPGIMTFVRSFIFNKNNTIIDRDSLDESCIPDWCASSFFGIKMGNFIKLNGFDSGFFMYCEDVDLCYRGKQQGLKLTYFSEIRGIHRANHGSKKLLSRNFYWHFSSAVRYMWCRINDRRK